jgi:hypothetical protein
MLFTPLLRKCPSLFVNHFVEALVVLNGCVDHDSYKAALSQGVRACCSTALYLHNHRTADSPHFTHPLPTHAQAESGTAVTMEGVDFLEGDGPEAATKRMAIYRAMLQHMTDEQRIQVTAKLTQDILGAATEEDGSEAGGIKIQSYHRASRFANGQRREALLRKLRRDESLVRDALAVLRCPDIKVAGGRGFGGSGGGAGGDGADDDADALMMEADAQGGAGGPTGAEAAAAAKGRLLSKVSRKHLLEHVVPELVSLKACLERAHSPLLKDVMEYLMDLMRAHKEEVKDALSASPTLFHEIEYDLQQFEREQEKKAQEAAAATAEARAAMPPPQTQAPAQAPEAPNSPSTADARRRSSVASARSSQRRRSSVSQGGRTPATGAAGAAAAGPGSAGADAGTGGKKTPGSALASAPRLRRSSAGAGLSRTPAEAIRAAMQPDGSGSVVSQALTPVPLKRRDEDDDNGENENEENAHAGPAPATRRTRGTAAGGKKAAKKEKEAPAAGKRRTRRGAAAAKEEEQEVEEEEEDGMRVNVTLPKASKAKWKVTAGRSPLDSAASKANVEATGEEDD